MYVDGFVAAVPASKKEVYRAFAATTAALFREYGAIRVVEAWGDDVPAGKVNDFLGAVQAKEGEVVVFSWIEYPNKAVRDAAVKKVFEDDRLKALGDMPFDGQRMIFGGFETILDER